MAQLSRPYQIGLAAIAVLAAAWLLLFQGHNSNNSGAGTTAQVPAPTVTHTVKSSAAPAKKAEGTAGQASGHGSASSIGGLGHAVEEARGAVSTSQTNAKQLAEKSQQASNETTTTSTPKPAETTAAPSSTKSAGAAATPSVKTSAPAKAKTNAKTQAPGAASRSTSSTAPQRTVEKQLQSGKIAVILFWSPKGADDRAVHSALRSLRGDRSLNIAIDEASASQVASFGTITRGIQVYGTPTLLFVNKKGRAITMTGLQDAFAIAQAVREARKA